ncbi:hypothetical protein Tco_0353014 [Tanacetum coccineum]
MQQSRQPTLAIPSPDVRNTTGRTNNPLLTRKTTSAVISKNFCETHYREPYQLMAISMSLEKDKKEKLEKYKQGLTHGKERKAPCSRNSEARRVHPQHSDSRQESSRYTENHSESEDSEGGHWKSKSRRKKSSVEDDDLHNLGSSKKKGGHATGVTCLISTLYRKCPCGLTSPSNLDSGHSSSQGQEAPSKSKERKKAPPAWRHQEGGHRQNFKKGEASQPHKNKKRPDRFTLLTKTPKESGLSKKEKIQNPTFDYNPG